MMIKHNIFRIFFMLLSALLMTACSSDIATDDEQPLPEGMGRIRITISTPENAQTRAVNAIPWEDPDHEWERLQTFRILICGTDNKVVQVISGTKEDLTEVAHTGSENVGTPNSTKSTHKSATVTSAPLPAGSYYIYATANYDDGYSVGSTVNPDATVKFANGYSENLIPMTGKLTTAANSNTMKEVSVTKGAETDAGTITVWRVIGKMQFYFTNESAGKIRIKGIEVEPINQASSGPGIYLFSKDNLESINNLAPQTLSQTGSEAGVTATWALHNATLQTSASVSESGVFEQAQLSYGANLQANGSIPAGDAAHTTLYKFQPTVKVTTNDDASAIILTVKPRSGLSFTPKKLSFTACRVATDGGNFSVVTVNGGTSTNVATDIRPERYNVSPYISRYEYDLSGSATTGEFKVKFYIYNLDTNKQYAFSDIVITGKVTNTGDTMVERITLPDGARADVGTVKYEPATPLELDATNGTGTLFFYVNETDATYTAVNNQLSLRFKIQRQNPTTQEWYDDEIRYGVTTHHDLTENGVYGGFTGGFNVIRRNDWIHIPVVLTDWQFRVEPLAFVPIAGYPATLLSSDGLTATFSTGGMIALQPFIKKYTDTNWRDFGNSEVTLVDITWKNSDGTIVSGDNKIVKTDFAYDPVTKCIIGELNNGISSGTHKTTMTVKVKLGPPDSQFDYSFTFNIILQK